MSYQDSSDEDNNLTVVRDDDPTDACPSRRIEVEDENVVDENNNEKDIEISDEESEADLIMPIRKSKDPSSVWTCTDGVLINS